MHANADLAQSRAGFDRDKLVSLAMFHIRFDVSGMELMDGARVSVGDVTEAMINPVQRASEAARAHPDLLQPLSSGYAARC